MRKIVTRRVPDVGASGLVVGQVRRAMRLRGRRIQHREKGVVAISTVCYKLEAWLADCISRVGSPGERFCVIRVGARLLVYLKSTMQCGHNRVKNS